MRSFLSYLLVAVGLFALASAQEQEQYIQDDRKLLLKERLSHLSHLSRQALLHQEDAELVKLQMKKTLEESGIDERAHVKIQVGTEQEEDAENRRKELRERRRRANENKPLDPEWVQKAITRKLHLLKYRGQE